jgi:hypothetical protein
MKRAICLVATIPLAVLVGCGGGDDSSPTQVLTPTVETPTALSKENFIKGGDGICAEVNAALGSLSNSSADSASTTAQRADLYEGMIERLHGLGNPTDDTGLDDFYSAGDDLVSAQKSAESAAGQNDATSLASAESEVASAEANFQSAASAYGFQDCGQGPSTPSTSTETPATVTPAAPTTPAAPVTPAPAPAPTGGATTGGGTGGATGGGTGTGTGGGTGGTSGGSGGVGPG